MAAFLGGWGFAVLVVVFGENGESEAFNVDNNTKEGCLW